MNSALSPAPLILAAVFTIALVAPSIVHRLGRTSLAFFAVIPAALAAWFASLLPPLLRGGELRSSLAWAPGLHLDIDLRLDALAAVMCLVITVIGAAVLAFSVRYFPIGDDGLAKYAGSLLAFTAAMLTLVLADNLILLVVGWELTGILSYLLIAHRVRRQPSRAAASQALMVTASGGLALLLGAILLGIESGTFTLSQILADPPSGAGVTAAAVLMLIGGISKSAILPFHFWLPGAMEAPTPASAYLHAATMVKAGIYLFARMTPIFGGLAFWGPTLVALGGGTMILAGVLALRQRDLKLLLAYGTVSQLGLLTLLIGVGTPSALMAAVALLIAHAVFKAPLFFVVGIIDVCTGSRDLTELSGLGRRAPALVALAAPAAISMAGIPPMVGFVGKEAGYAAVVDAGGLGGWAAAAMVLGSMLTVAYSARLLWGAFASKPGVKPIAVSRISWWMSTPTLLIMLLGVVLGVVPQPMRALLAEIDSTQGAPTSLLAAWHGFDLPLALTATSVIGGAAIFITQRSVERRRARLTGPNMHAGRGYRAIAGGVDIAAGRVTAGTQRGSLPVSLGAIMAVLVFFPGSVLVTSGLRPESVPLYSTVPQLLLAVVTMVLALTIFRVRSAIAAVLMVGGIGYAIAVFYVLRGAPDLALTQILVETVTLVVAVLIFVRIPSEAILMPRMRRVARGFRAALAVAVGALMTALALIIPSQRRLPPVSEGMGDLAREAGGNNIVNVILVDIRGWDTFGEISVLVAAAVGVSSLIFLRNPWMGRHGRAGSPHTALPVATNPALPSDDNPSPWLVTDAVPRRSLLLEVATRLVFHLIVIFSLYVLFVGHDEPGGGFAGGLIAGIAITLRYLAGGRYELAESAPVDAGVIIGSGLTLAAGVSAAGLAFGRDALTSAIWQADLPLIGHVSFVTSTLFDIGVYLVVVGVVLEILRSVGGELDRQAHRAGRAIRRPMWPRSSRAGARGTHSAGPQQRGRAMTVDLILAVTIGVLFAVGVYLMVSRNMIKVTFGFLVVGHGTNLLLLASGTWGAAPILGDDGLQEAQADPLPQAFVLTSIVITLAVSCFLLAMVYRNYLLTQDTHIADEPEDILIDSDPAGDE